MPSVLRILDANANRAREALRVMEDTARFVLDDAALAGDLKRLRHELARALEPVEGLAANRDTPGDVGTTIKTDRELTRGGVADVAAAAGKRLGEALRTIEEFAKTLPQADSALARAAESLRYRGYGLDQRLQAALGTGRARQWRLCVLLTESLCTRHPWTDVLEACLDGGVDCIQVREKAMDGGPLLERCRQVVARCRQRGVAVIVNDRPDIALLSGADGVHVGQTDLPVAEVRRLVGRQLLVGVSTAGLDQASAAVDQGADYCGLGPMFATTTKHKPDLVGPDYVRRFVAAFPDVPHLAISGIHAGNVDRLVAAGARGIAVCSAVCSAPDPASAVRELSIALRQ